MSGYIQYGNIDITRFLKGDREKGPDTFFVFKCEAEGGRWIESEQSVKQAQPVPVAEKFQPYCQGPLKFEREREAQSEASQQTSLFVFAIGGALAVAGSLLVKQLKAVAPGLMLGGIAAFFMTGIHIWTLAPGIGRLITTVVVFVILVGVGLYVFRGADQST